MNTDLTGSGGKQLSYKMNSATASLLNDLPKLEKANIPLNKENLLELFTYIFNNFPPYGNYKNIKHIMHVDNENMNIWKDMRKDRIQPNDFLACVEISAYSKNKYELDKETGLMILDRVLYTSTHYPMNYGFIPLTYCDDHDPLDVFVYCTQEILPMSLVECRPIGAIDMIDNNQIDTKLIAVPVGEPTYAGFKDISDLPPHLIDELIHFLRV